MAVFTTSHKQGAAIELVPSAATLIPTEVQVPSQTETSNPELETEDGQQNKGDEQKEVLDVEQAAALLAQTLRNWRPDTVKFKPVISCVPNSPSCAC